MKVAVIMGSTSDWGVMSAAVETLEELGIEYEKRVISAHRTPHLMFEYATTAKQRGIGAIIAGAGGAAHVAGVTAALTTVPVIGVPIKTSALGGLDSLLSIPYRQRPSTEQRMRLLLLRQSSPSRTRSWRLVLKHIARHRPRRFWRLNYNLCLIATSKHKI